MSWERFKEATGPIAVTMTSTGGRPREGVLLTLGEDRSPAMRSLMALRDRIAALMGIAKFVEAHAESIRYTAAARCYLAGDRDGAMAILSARPDRFLAEARAARREQDASSSARWHRRRRPRVLRFPAGS